MRPLRAADQAEAAPAEPAPQPALAPAVLDAPAVAFPPDGSEVELLPEGLLVRVQGGKAPFTWLANGVPVAVSLTASEVMLASLGRGFITLSVIDAEGRSARSQVRLR